ncbi:MAG: aldo/keto reductase [Clostridia bacterium]|nr:aldo/keto reductase [Clostridia bacterium]
MKEERASRHLYTVPYGKSREKIVRLGFGVLRLPSSLINGKIVYDIDKSIAVIRHAIDAGINYFDTAPAYCNKLSESILGKAIKGNRSKLYISTKFDTENGDLMPQLEKSLKDLGTDYIDYYHFWSMDLKYFLEKGLSKGGPMDQMLELKRQGVIKHIAFSSHDTPENIIEIMKHANGAFEAMLCQYNLLDRRNEPAIAYAAQNGIAVSLMGPMGGGRLGAPTELMEFLPTGASTASAETALRFVFSNPHVDIALSGMNTFEMIDQNLAIANDDTPLSREELQHIENVVAEKRKLSELYCTACNYCMPCPAGINIPGIFKIYNYKQVYGMNAYAHRQYALIGIDENLDFNNAAYCLDCKLCEKKCPQKLEISSEMKRVHQSLTESSISKL